MKRVIGHPFEVRSKLGLYYEKVLKPALEKAVGEPLVKTSEDLDTMDFEGRTCYVELKTRGDQYHPSLWYIKKDGWILPTCKIHRAREEVKEGKRVVFFYFWRAGKSLYRWDFSEEGLKDCKEEYPSWHQDLQKQTYIKEHHWVKVF